MVTTRTPRPTKSKWKNDLARRLQQTPPTVGRPRRHTSSHQQTSTAQVYSSPYLKTTTWKWRYQQVYQLSKCSAPETIPVLIISSAVLIFFRPSQSVTCTPTLNQHAQTISQYEESSTLPQKEPPHPPATTGGQLTGMSTEQN